MAMTPVLARVLVVIVVRGFGSISRFALAAVEGLGLRCLGAVTVRMRVVVTLVRSMRFVAVLAFTVMRMAVFVLGATGAKSKASYSNQGEARGSNGHWYLRG